ncbi:hypothetical protein B2J88_30580 [Rhodococcus sp. SRB_17]|nr:hypothetical protein [Rhodococcus sp. SRB_17]
MTDNARFGRPPRFPGVPFNEIPVLVPLHSTLVQTDEIALWITGVHVYTTCITFSVQANLRATDRMPDMYGFGRPASGCTPPMLFGVQDSEGRISTNLPKVHTGLQANGGGGDARRHHVGYILNPVPPAGPLELFIAWPHFGVDETQVTIDATAIASAVSDVTVLWEEVEPRMIDIDDRTTPAIEIPPGGWFEAAAESQKRVPVVDPSGARRINFAFVGEEAPVGEPPEQK